MPPFRAATPASTGFRTPSLTRVQTAPYPSSRPVSAARPPTASSRPRTARPRTATSTTGNDTNVIAAITEGRGVATSVGLCFLSLDTGECILSQISDSQTYGKTIHKLAVFDPLEIVMPESNIIPQKTKLCRIIEENLPGASIVAGPRRHFREDLGMEYMNQLTLEEDLESVKVAISASYYAISATAAIIKHAEISRNVVFTHGSLRVKYQGSEGSMLIDYLSIRNLELVQNIQNPKSAQCLYGVLDHCHTPMGKRLLRSNILQPSSDLHTIDARLDAVTEIIQNEDMFQGTMQALKGFQDFDRLLTMLLSVSDRGMPTEDRISSIILLKHTLEKIPPLLEAITGCRSGLLVAIQRLCSDLRIRTAIDLIKEVVNEDATWTKGALGLRHQRCYAVKSGVNGLLDVARQKFKEVTSDVFTLLDTYRSQYDLAIEIKFEEQRGYYMLIKKTELQKRQLPGVFTNISSQGGKLLFDSLDMSKKNAKLRHSLNEIYVLSFETVLKLIDDVRIYIGCLYKVCEGIAMLDMITSFAYSATIAETVRPEFSDTLAVRRGRYPVLPEHEIVPNDAFASQTCRFQIITGPNMSGKSTYLRQIALLSIMAQIGCYVPAEYASFPLLEQLFTRISVDDGLEFNASSFSSEMREMAFILQNVTRASLVLVDELGRGTSVSDGLAISLAICGALVESRAIVLFATHFKEIAMAFEGRPGFVNLHLHTEVKSERVIAMNYQLKDGVMEDAHYGSIPVTLQDTGLAIANSGIRLAKLSSLPDSLVTRAQQVSEMLTSRRRQQQRNSQSHVLAERRRMILQLQETLKQAYEGNMDDESLSRWLQRVQARFVEDFASID